MISLEMDKPLKDWTLGEVKHYCATRMTGCEGCKFGREQGCTFEDCVPARWDFVHDKISFTTEEIELIKAIRVLFPEASQIGRIGTKDVYVLADDGNETILFAIDASKFPSFDVFDFWIKIDDILESKS